jgi:hypothetical protein
VVSFTLLLLELEAGWAPEPVRTLWRSEKSLAPLTIKILEVEGGSSGSHSLENSVWKRLWTYRKTDYYLNLNYNLWKTEGTGSLKHW